MKASISLLLGFLAPLTVAATVHAQDATAPSPQPVALLAATPAPPVATPVAPVAPLAPGAVVPFAPAPYALAPVPTPVLERRSEGLRIAGIVLIPVGSLALFGGALFALGSAVGDTDPSDAAATRRSNTSGLVGLTPSGSIRTAGIRASSRRPFNVTSSVLPS